VCYCGNSLEFKECCYLFIKNKSFPNTPVELMKARYSAFVIGDIDYIYDSHHIDTRKEISKEDIKNWSLNSKWLGLEILNIGEINNDSLEGTVEFIAKYKQNAIIYTHHEKSLFKKSNNRWYYHSQLETSDLNNIKKLGRNSLCFCGSNKKFKKCCGK